MPSIVLGMAVFRRGGAVMEDQSVKCSVCKEREGIVADYRIKPEFEATATHKTLLECYDKYSVCSKCFKLTDKAFRALLRKNASESK